MRLGSYFFAMPLVGVLTLPAVLSLPLMLGLIEPAAWAMALQEPGLLKASLVALVSAILGTVLATFLSMALLSGLGENRRSWLSAVLPPLLATPHAAMAVGLAFLIAPSGWLLRLLSPWATGLERPPLFSLLYDEWGLSLALGLALKELPFITLLGLTANRRETLRPFALAAQSLGYGPQTAFLKVTLPQLLKSLSLPITIAFIYGLSAVDMGSVLGPTTPAPLAVLIFGKLSDPDPLAWQVGLVLSLYLAVLTLCVLLAFAGLLGLLSGSARAWAATGKRATAAGQMLRVSNGLGLFAIGVAILALLSLLLWAFAKRWRFPEAWPSKLTGLDWLWERALFSVSSFNTLWLALVSSLLGLGLALAFLLAERQQGRGPNHNFLWTSFAIAPLLIPQMTLIPAVHFLNLKVLGFSPWVTALWGHTMFTAAYSYLTLRGPLLSLNPKYRQAGMALGQSPLSCLIRLELPLLLSPLMASLAIALSVSVASYLPTLTLGQGRLDTLTVEAVAAATGGSRRVAAQFALAQTFWALVFFFGALAVPKIVHRNRKGMLNHVS